jgi:hypothetical protein
MALALDCRPFADSRALLDQDSVPQRHSVADLDIIPHDSVVPNLHSIANNDVLVNDNVVANDTIRPQSCGWSNGGGRRNLRIQATMRVFSIEIFSHLFLSEST